MVCRELTKKFEEFIRGSLEEVMEWAQDGEVRGEFCLLIEGRPPGEKVAEEEWWTSLPVKEHVEHYMEKEGASSKDAIKKVSLERSLPKRDVYHVSFKPLPKEQLVKQLLEEGIEPQFASLAANLTNHYEEAVELCRNEWFAQARIIVLGNQ